MTSKITFIAALLFLGYQLITPLQMLMVKGDQLDPTMKALVSDFEEDFNVKIDFPVYIAEIPGSNTALGVCFMLSGTEKVILNSRWWYTASKIDQRTVVYHELTHCAFHTYHQNGYLADGCPQSIMYPRIHPQDCVLRHWDRYLKEINQYRKEN